MKEFLTVLCIIIGLGLVSTGIVYLIEKEREICDTVVVMKDDRMYKCAETHTHDGLTHIYGCDGTRIKVPTVDIRIIEKIEVK